MPLRLAIPRLAALGLATLGLATLSLASACWTGAGASSSRHSTSPASPCPAKLVGLVHDATTGVPLAGATVVIETVRGSVATELTDQRGRFETAAVAPPAQLRIYYGEHAAWHPLAPCQPPLRIGVRLAP
jgi:hypothetical protein